MTKNKFRLQFIMQLFCSLKNAHTRRIFGFVGKSEYSNPDAVSCVNDKTSTACEEHLIIWFLNIYNVPAAEIPRQICEVYNK